MQDLRWVYVTLPTATFLLGIDSDGVVRAGPPYAHRYLGHHERHVAADLRRRGAEFVRLPSPPPRKKDPESD